MQQAKALTQLLIQKAEEKLTANKFKNPFFNLAISGGNSVNNLFSLWTGEYVNKIPWNNIELFWVDERCVPPTDFESNYGNANNLLLEHISIPQQQVHRIRGEDDPVVESLRYSKLVEELLPCENGIPIFDFIILGIGEDGHTSSIFPGQQNLLSSMNSYAPSVNPYSRQNRVALTGMPIIKAELAVYYLVGDAKKNILEKIDKSNGNPEFPAGYLMKNGKNTRIFWDREF